MVWGHFLCHWLKDFENELNFEDFLGNIFSEVNRE
jgi:hypothetical protein